MSQSDNNKIVAGIYNSSNYLNNLESKQAYNTFKTGNRPHILNASISRELNTYINFGIFPTFGDTYPDDVTGDTSENTVSDVSKYKYTTPGGYGPGTPGVRSLFNRAGAVIIGSKIGSYNIDVRNPLHLSDWRLTNNVPLMDNPVIRNSLSKRLSCSISDLVAASQAGQLGQETYAYSDFMYCKHLGKVSNNYLITLRRFPSPVDDFIGATGDLSNFDVYKHEADTESHKFTNISNNPSCIGCMVTWMGVSGNDLSQIMKYSFKMPFKEQSARLEDSKTDADTNQTILGGLFNAFDESYQKQYMEGRGGESVNAAFNHFGINLGNPPYTDHRNFKDRNKVYGPIDAVNSTYIRSDEGLVFKQSMTLVFEYELRSYNGINPRQAMLDLISNILNVTYITGSFWGGGIKSYGASQSNIFTNLEVFKTSGGFTDFADAMATDLTTLGNKVKQNLGLADGDEFTLKSAWKALKGILNTLGGMLMAGMLNKLGRPQKAMYNTLLSPAPIGFWHLTIGNPKAPMMSIGNMVLTNVKIEHGGPLGIDDFPTDLKVTVDLDRGKPRDLREIEKIYMHGNDRIYTPMSDKVFNMYINSVQYKHALANGSKYDPALKVITTFDDGSQVKEDAVFYGNTGETTEPNARVLTSTYKKKGTDGKDDDKTVATTINYQRNKMGIDELLINALENNPVGWGIHWKEATRNMAKYFGTKDIFSIFFASAEQEYGASNTEKAIDKSKDVV